MGDQAHAEGDRPRADADVLVEYLRDRDIPCPACSYNLRGVSGGVCPECGLAVTIRVAEHAPHGAYWYAALSALAWPLLFNGMLWGAWIVLLVSTIRARGPLGDVLRDQRGIAAAVSMTMTLTCLGMLCFLLWTRRRPWRPRTRRIVLSVLWIIFAAHAFWLVPEFLRQVMW